jgi:hypothetical protein
MLNPFGNQRIVQCAWVVNDIDAAMARWTRTMGVGPFFVAAHRKWEDPHYRGRPLRTDYTIALAQAGDFQVELLCQHDDTPSVYRDLYPKGKEGMHHMAIIVKDYDSTIADFKAKGFEQAFWGKRNGMRMSFIDTSPATGIMLEVLEETSALLKSQAFIRESGRTWDGVTDPVRVLP